MDMDKFILLLQASNVHNNCTVRTLKYSYFVYILNTTLLGPIRTKIPTVVKNQVTISLYRTWKYSYFKYNLGKTNTSLLPLKCIFFKQFYRCSRRALCTRYQNTLETLFLTKNQFFYGRYQFMIGLYTVKTLWFGLRSAGKALLVPFSSKRTNITVNFNIMMTQFL